MPCGTLSGICSLKAWNFGTRKTSVIIWAAYSSALGGYTFSGLLSRGILMEFLSGATAATQLNRRRRAPAPGAGAFCRSLSAADAPRAEGLRCSRIVSMRHVVATSQHVVFRSGYWHDRGRGVGAGCNFFCSPSHGKIVLRGWRAGARSTQMRRVKQLPVYTGKPQTIHEVYAFHLQQRVRGSMGPTHAHSRQRGFPDPGDTQQTSCCLFATRSAQAFIGSFFARAWTGAGFRLEN